MEDAAGEFRTAHYADFPDGEKYKFSPQNRGANSETGLNVMQQKPTARAGVMIFSVMI